MKEYFLVPSNEYDKFKNKCVSDPPNSIVYSKPVDKDDHHSRTVVRKEDTDRDKVDSILSDERLSPEIANKLHNYLSHLYSATKSEEKKKHCCTAQSCRSGCYQEAGAFFRLRTFPSFPLTCFSSFRKKTSRTFRK